ncbi:ectonucleotide pyrophosphatase/phosphodiesterase [Stenotrophomonas sp. YIM B06876]|uniref:alkaline phosphatase family protein n=1 Tax=Stenotrophomonas sp. YIM B06876 TaxID=3060211 RepID=UPI0027384D5D|nr:ectonucleotide pyrophosphatase/phosphodiesterase [Stenotrophomonas sp. YIM B06876]
MISIRLPLVALATAVLGACASSPTPHPPATVPATVLLISIDGLRADMLDRGISPNLSRLAREGVRAKSMTPSYPSLTFPNHYTLVTGLRPDHHGIIHNSMSEDELGSFRLGDRDAVINPGWWGGEPIWVGAEKAGRRTATWSWPGSEAPIHGIHPSQWRPYDESVPLDTRADQVLEWLGQRDEPAQLRLVTLYAEAVDVAGHSHGPESAEYAAAVTEVDASLGRLLAGMQQRGVLERTNIIVVSDHGMATVKDGHVIAIEDMVAPEVAKVVTTGQTLGFTPLPGKQAEAEQRLLGAHERYDCWKREQLPARWHYGKNPRVPPLVCQMHEGWNALSRASIAKRTAGDRGSHGYDPALPSMQAVFVARGPSFRQGKQLPTFDNVDVYPLLTRLIGIPAAPNDGNPETLLPALR